MVVLDIGGVVEAVGVYSWYLGHFLVWSVLEVLM